MTPPGPPRFSANTGFLWTALPLPARVRAAARAGFDAVEFHDDAQTTDPAALAEALAETGLPVLSLNTRMADTAGCAAIPALAAQARRDIDAAAAAAERIGAAAIHVLAGRTEDPGAARAFGASLRHALAATDRMVLIEPICRAAMPGYFLHDIDQAAAILDEIADPRLCLMFDWFHIETATGDAAARFAAHAPRIGHVQIASVPARTEPEPLGHPAYGAAIPAMRAAGYAGAFGAEYRPAGAVEAGLGWLAALRAL
jgi:hydroxypyruvate isomerase